MVDYELDDELLLKVVGKEPVQCVTHILDLVVGGPDRIVALGTSDIAIKPQYIGNSITMKSVPQPAERRLAVSWELSGLGG